MSDGVVDKGGLRFCKAELPIPSISKDLVVFETKENLRFVIVPSGNTVLCNRKVELCDRLP